MISSSSKLLVPRTNSQTPEHQLLNDRGLARLALKRYIYLDVMDVITRDVNELKFWIRNWK